ncbi:Flp family type IVb pilin [Pseudomonas lurida]|jgi:pilus assembly protein Flp/PilA|uniref:Flp family type IVb pilin n=1 Tax=Pseudomonas quebecensis TaxID=2995174 RepID=A0ABY6QFV5_9PSED|nr:MULTISPECIES: Flp family type IVb pilin [Pseudomonas]MBA1295692.1 Flp family type IVb pilin [Pseudomonas lurida]MCP1514357.1 pilus assembly protein Flp/PilA [Pseudomonas rhodesiae]MCX4063383.1 Flp family type IVb pilin [Pseudomonas quebecensis]MDF9768076.1 pilus assembly protein Flp/PilA [Pseudomonas rhodesiae]UZW17933.1 Flp family type IVb pilin [Pseudomonas quebecensis]
MFLDQMLKLYVQAQLFFKRDEGASGIEYAIIVALVALVIVGAGAGLGDKIKSIFDSIATKMTT